MKESNQLIHLTIYLHLVMKKLKQKLKIKVLRSDFMTLAPV
jgi:hypothetical protein